MFPSRYKILRNCQTEDLMSLACVGKIWPHL